MKTFKTFCEDRDYKVGDHVWIKHPTDVAVTLTGQVKKIHPNDQVTVKHKNGTIKTYPTKDASKEFQHLNRNPYEKSAFEEK